VIKRIRSSSICAFKMILGSESIISRDSMSISSRHACKMERTFEERRSTYDDDSRERAGMAVGLERWTSQIAAALHSNTLILAPYVQASVLDYWHTRPVKRHWEKKRYEDNSAAFVGAARRVSLD
jgi:hypothetical protein